jgi:hypothetical protein
MSRFRVFLITALVAVAGLAAVAPSASAQASPLGPPQAPFNENASCMGSLSSFVGASALAPLFTDQTRSDFAGQPNVGPKPGEGVKEIAQSKGEGAIPILQCAEPILNP